MSFNSSNLPVQRPDIKLKLTCVGDGGVGKTCLLIVYSQKRFPTVSSLSPLPFEVARTSSIYLQDYVPTVFENYVLNEHHEGKIIEFALWDTAGQESVFNLLLLVSSLYYS